MQTPADKTRGAGVLQPPPAIPRSAVLASYLNSKAQGLYFLLKTFHCLPGLNVMLKYKIVIYCKKYFEPIFILLGIVVAGLITYLVPNSISFLNFFFLPIILAGYFVGLRLSVPGAVFCISVVLFYSIMSPAHFQPPKSVDQVAIYVLTWGCFLVLAGAIVGYQQERIKKKNESLNRVYHELLVSCDELKRARAETVIGMATLTECRDRDTGLHLERVSQFCQILAEELRRTPPLDSYITEEYIEDLVLSSVLHDIGKVAVPDAILLKPGTLCPEEFNIIKTHTMAGGDALAAIEARMEGRSFFTLGKQIAYSHHERWDGGGYPQGLQGGDIPLSARIVAVADAYDAMTSDRIYCKALPHEEALRIIRENAGTKFDPQVVRAFLNREVDIQLVARDPRSSFTAMVTPPANETVLPQEAADTSSLPGEKLRLLTA